MLLALSQIALWIWRGGEMLPALLGGPAGFCVAGWTSILLLLASVALGRWPQPSPAPPQRSAPWLDTIRRLLGARGSRLALGGCAVYCLVALLAPALAPHDANRLGDGVATHSLPPLSRLHLVMRRNGIQLAANEVELAGEVVRLRRGGTWSEMARSELRGARPEDWHTTRLHLLGTDHLGRDLFGRLLMGSRISLSVGILSALLAMGLGALVGGVAGWSSPAVDGVLMRCTDAALAFPRLFLILLVLTVLPGSFVAVVVVLGATGWMIPSRLVRAEILTLRDREFIGAARALGQSRPGILFRHLLPNALAPLLVAATLRVGDTMLVEAGLSFLGLGVPPPHASWGNLISSGRPALVDSWWLAVFPGLAIVGAVLAFNVLGDGLRRALQPR